jgi:hypothetical protein
MTKVHSVQDDPQRDGIPATGLDPALATETDEAGAFARRLREEVRSWRPRRGPDYADLIRRAEPFAPRWVVYPLASAALATIIFAAFVVMVSLHLGSWAAGAPVQSHLP